MKLLRAFARPTRQPPDSVATAAYSVASQQKKRTRHKTCGYVFCGSARNQIYGRATASAFAACILFSFLLFRGSASAFLARCASHPCSAARSAAGTLRCRCAARSLRPPWPRLRRSAYCGPAARPPARFARTLRFLASGSGAAFGWPVCRSFASLLSLLVSSPSLCDCFGLIHLVFFFVLFFPFTLVSFFRVCFLGTFFSL